MHFESSQWSLLENMRAVFSADRIYDIQHLPSDHSVNRILKKIYSPKENTGSKLLWDASFFGLDQSSLFKNLPNEIKSQILQDLTDHNLFVAYHVETSGFFFTSKMITLSETVEERSIYARLCGDEAKHLSAVTPFLNIEINQNTKEHKLMKLLAQVIQECSKQPMIFLTQIVLEGFGIPYYQNMKDHCLNEGFKEVLKDILVDEAYHHGSGLVLFDEKKMSDTDQQITAELTAKMVQILRMGAAAKLKSSIEARISQSLNESELRLLLTEAQAVHAVQGRGLKIERLIRSSASDKLQAAVESTGVFKPLTLEQLMSVG